MRGRLIVGLTALAMAIVPALHAEAALEKQSGEGGAFLGIYPSELENEDREALELGDVAGVLVEDVVEDGPAADAGLKPGDVITAVDGSATGSLKGLRAVLKKHEPGDEVKVQVLRKGKREEFKVELASAPETLGHDIEISKLLWHGDEGGFLGVDPMTLKGQLAAYFKVDEGVLVKEVVEDSPAEKAGIKAGDVIVSVAGDAVESSPELIKAVRSHEPGSEVAIEAVRDGRRKTFKVELAEAPGGAAIGKGKTFRWEFNSDEMDPGAIREMVQDALGNLKVRVQDDDLKQELKELREELEQLKGELKQLREKSD